MSDINEETSNTDKQEKIIFKPKKARSLRTRMKAEDSDDEEVIEVKLVFKSSKSLHCCC